MKFASTEIEGVWLISPERHQDDRGYFARTWCADEFRERGLASSLLQCSISFNHKTGTLRGMHYQAEPHGEVKLVRCQAGAIYDVLIDLRQESATYMKWQGFELTAENGNSLYIPKGIAHGFQTLADRSEVFYQMADPFVPESACGVRYNDPAFAIRWPREVSVISDRDAEYADYQLSASPSCASVRTSPVET